MKSKSHPGLKIICNNRKASFNYFFHEFYEAGLSLKGSEIKSLRDGKANISEAYATNERGEFFLVNSHIPLYKQSIDNFTFVINNINITNSRFIFKFPNSSYYIFNLIIQSIKNTF